MSGRAPNYIALAVPFFFVLIGIELAVAVWRRRKVYRFADAISDLGCGVTQRILLLFFGGALLVGYVAIYRHRLVDLGRHPALAWTVALVGVDFIYYWWHRASHRLNFLWAAHVVHHQSEDYNLAVALRQGVLTPVTSLPFALPLALIGIPPLVYLAASSLNTLYQFWIHTELVRSLGPLEAILNTPSHHRVHHARNPRYLDRNYGAMFIVWDRLFGTYQPEVERPEYGITKPLRSFNVLWAQVQPLADLTAASLAAPRWRDRLAVWLAPPERDFAWYREPVGPAPAGGKYDVPVRRRMLGYVLVNFAAAIVATTALMLASGSLSAARLAGGAALVLLTVWVMGGLIEGRRWARRLEPARVAAVVLALLAI
jgi:sterol desaturase/sphingolipid hydroxylase (fatty acid hydroxylase superfamily)